MDGANAAVSPLPPPAPPTSIASAPDPLEAIVEQQLQDKPLPHPDLAALAREAVSPAESEVYDPLIHETDPTTGGPIFNKDGSLRRKRGRVAGKAYGDVLDGGAPGGAVGEGGGCSPLQAKREARLCAISVFKALQSLGDHWQPTPEEEKAVIEPLAQWLQEVGGIGLPTWAEVAVAFGAYLICRINLARFMPPMLQGVVAGPAIDPAAMQQMVAMEQKAAAANPPQSNQPPSPLFPPPPGTNSNGVRRVVEARQGVSGGEGFVFGNATAAGR